MTEPVRLVLATANKGKVLELVDLLGDDFEIEPRPRDLAETIEDGKTLLDNATKKAVEVFAHTGAISLADDTGLFVDALEGKPGVRSARFADRRGGPQGDDAANREKLLSELGGVGDVQKRRAYFETVVAIVGAEFRSSSADADSSSTTSEVALVPLVGRGRVYGHITAEPRGDGGFGYDSVFQPEEGDGRTFAEMKMAEKQAISHRGRALVQARTLLEAANLKG